MTVKNSTQGLLTSSFGNFNIISWSSSGVCTLGLSSGIDSILDIWLLVHNSGPFLWQIFILGHVITTGQTPPAEKRSRDAVNRTEKAPSRTWGLNQFCQIRLCKCLVYKQKKHQTILILYILYISSMQDANRTKSYIAQTLSANLNCSTGLWLDLIPIRVSSQAPSFVCTSTMWIIVFPADVLLAAASDARLWTSPNRKQKNWI